jgi:hypothetical protein
MSNGGLFFKTLYFQFGQHLIRDWKCVDDPNLKKSMENFRCTFVLVLEFFFSKTLLCVLWKIWVINKLLHFPIFLNSSNLWCNRSIVILSNQNLKNISNNNFIMFISKVDILFSKKHKRCLIPKMNSICPYGNLTCEAPCRIEHDYYQLH